MLKAREQLAKRVGGAEYGAGRGQKMSPEERRWHRAELKAASEHKKGGLLDNVYEKTAQKKITRVE